MIDLDGLKHINDTYGHEFGDKYIQIAADVFMDSVPDGTVVSRPGGEPFPLHLSAGIHRIRQTARYLCSMRILRCIRLNIPLRISLVTLIWKHTVQARNNIMKKKVERV